jgi:regulator of RNase E activity RraA
VDQVSAENRAREGSDDHLLLRCERIGTSTWSDALDELATEGVVTGISQRSGSGRFAAYAVTAREVAGPLHAFARGEFAVGSLIASVAPGEVLVVDAGGAQISTFGRLASLATSLHGAAAVVPRAQIPAVLAKAEAIVEQDRMIEAALRAGQSFSEAATAADYI